MLLPLRLPRRAVELHCALCNEVIPEGEAVWQYFFFGLDRPEIDVFVHEDRDVCKAALA